MLLDAPVLVVRESGDVVCVSSKVWALLILLISDVEPQGISGTTQPMLNFFSRIAGLKLTP